MINLRNLEAFLAVSESLSFTQAARRLHKTQSAVSQAVRQLEDELGVVLLDRTAGRVKLTGTGLQMVGQAQQLLEQVHRMTSLAREHQHTRLSELRFGMVDSFATAVGPTLISSLLKEAINLSLWSDLRRIWAKPWYNEAPTLWWPMMSFLRIRRWCDTDCSKSRLCWCSPLRWRGIRKPLIWLTWHARFQWSATDLARIWEAKLMPNAGCWGRSPVVKFKSIPQKN